MNSRTESLVWGCCSVGSFYFFFFSLECINTFAVLRCKIGFRGFFFTPSIRLFFYVRQGGRNINRIFIGFGFSTGWKKKYAGVSHGSVETGKLSCNPSLYYDLTLRQIFTKNKKKMIWVYICHPFSRSKREPVSKSLFALYSWCVESSPPIILSIYSLFYSCLSPTELSILVQLHKNNPNHLNIHYKSIKDTRYHVN